jgi:hypothetical protein
LLLLCTALAVMSLLRWFRRAGNTVVPVAHGSDPDHPVEIADLGAILVEVNGGPEVVQAQRVSHRFAIHNPSQQPLVLSVASRSCGCLTVEPPDAIPPGGTGHVELAFQAVGVAQVRQEQVTFNTNLQRPRTITLVLKAQTLPVCEWVGERRVYVPYGGPYEIEKQVRLHMQSPRAPPECTLRCQQSAVTVGWSSPWRSEHLGKGIYRHTRSFVMRLSREAQGVLETGGVVIAELALQESQREHKATLEWTSNPPVRVFPPNLFVAGERESLEISGESKFRIQRMEDTLGLLDTVVDSSEMAASHRVEIKCVRPPAEGLQETILRIWVEGLAVPHIAVPVYVAKPGDEE